MALMKKNPDPYLEKIKELVLKELFGEPVRVYLFGSRARGVARIGSDVDLAVEASAVFDDSKLRVLREKLEDSSLPYKVDIINLNSADALFKKEILKDAILWKDWN